MCRLIAILLFAFVASSLAALLPNGLLPQLDGRIVGGSNAAISSFPWQVSLQRGGSHSCGGSIYNNRIIVTAAHCLKGASVSSLRVRAGSTNWSSGGVLVPVAAIRVHENYNANTMVNDVGIIRLSSSLSYGGNIRNVSVATTAPANGAAAVVSGWGTKSYGSSSLPTTLQSVNVSIISLSRCGSSAYGYGNEVRSTMICAAANRGDACQGDSGGPLVSGGKLVGIVSWGYGCAYPNYPGVYADAATLRSWIVKAAASI